MHEQGCAMCASVVNEHQYGCGQTGNFQDCINDETAIRFIFLYLLFTKMYQIIDILRDIQNLKWSMQMVIHERSLCLSHD